MNINKYRSKLIIKQIAPFISKDKKVLDIGCGNGMVSYEIKKYFNCDITGIDTLSYIKKDIFFKKMEEEDKIPFNDKEFDIGLFITVLHHISFEKQIKIIKEALRVCSEVLVYEQEPTFRAKVIDYLFNKIFYNKKMHIPLAQRTKEEWGEFFRKNKIDYTNYDVKRPGWWYPSINFLFCLKKENNIT